MNTLKTVAALVLLTLAGCMPAECPVDNPTTTLTVNEHRITAEVASIPSARRCGLAFRDSLPADHGMLFVVAEDRILEFWMKNTVIPLMIAYLDAEGGILEIHALDPHQPQLRVTSSVPARYALETSPGWFQAHGIGVGDQVGIHLPAGLVIE